MVFGMILIAGTVPFIRPNCKNNASVYKEILKKHVVPNSSTAINQPVVLMQDNGPCHTVMSIKTFLSAEDVTVMECPGQIENIWKLVSEKAKEKNQRNIEEWTNLKGELDKISVAEYKKFISSYSKRCQAII